MYAAQFASLPLDVATTERVDPKIEDLGPPMFHAGILFAANRPKGDVLLAFLQQIKFRPEYFVLVDDREENLASTRVAIAKLNAEHWLAISFVGVHYTAVKQYFLFPLWILP